MIFHGYLCPKSQTNSLKRLVRWHDQNQPSIENPIDSPYRGKVQCFSRGNAEIIHGELGRYNNNVIQVQHWNLELYKLEKTRPEVI